MQSTPKISNNYLKKERTIPFYKPKIMGILNVTTDSFYDGSKCIKHDEAFRYAQKLISEGADIIDIGGETSKPGSRPTDVETEIKRIIPVIKALREDTDITISVDTRNSTTARLAIENGATMINDISALQDDINMVNVLRDYQQIKVVLMHKKGVPLTMQENPVYSCVLTDILEFFKERIGYAVNKGITLDRIIIDPGIGFGKNFEHNITILQNLEAFNSLGLPILLGASRKSFLNSIYASAPEDRLIGSLATTVIAGYKKIDFIRVHDVKEHKELIDCLSVLTNPIVNNLQRVGTL
ncbi:MAG: dihydropteroate synthase [Candidatus Cloacimonetes bacterium]|nr:dihydropteroate synthase [Candidatus Cloacimonadota bacterium]